MRTVAVDRDADQQPSGELARPELAQQQRRRSRATPRPIPSGTIWSPARRWRS
ncbi:hypothetical protein AB5I41_11915 [Sphingomonas sp. MMS24-JH45]